MAQLIPPQPTGSLPRGTLKLHAALKALPDTWTVWQNLRSMQGPDFLLHHRPTARVFLLHALRLSKSELQSGASPLADLEGLSSFGSESLFGALIARAATHHELEIPPSDIAHNATYQDVSFLGRSDLSPESIEARLEAIAKPPVLADWFDELRSAFAPEGLLDPSMVMRSFDAAEPAAQPRRNFLDLRQEILAKRDLDLSPDTASLPGEFGLRLLTGVAGAGKTLVLLHRAVILGKRFPKAHILILTFNKPLMAELDRRLHKLHPGTHVECRTFHGWCGRVWKSQGRRPPIDATRKLNTIREIGARCAPGQHTLIENLGSEFDWIHDQGLRTWDAYRDAERRGRGFRLSAAQRETVWKGCIEWREFLERGLHGDYPHFGYRFQTALTDGLAPTVRYDAILIDEAQFFAPTWFDVARRHLKPSGNLFLSADPSQGFLRNGTSWNAAGLSVRGRTDKLARSYRTTRSILEFAWGFLQRRAPEIAEETVLPDLTRMDQGHAPTLIRESDLAGQIRACVKKISSEISKGLRASDFLVLVVDFPSETMVGNLLLGHSVNAVRAEDAGDQNAVRVCTLERATGLEAPIVYLLGVSQLLEAEGNPLLDAEVREALCLRHARQLYMGFTRAGCDLRIGWSGPVPDELRGIASNP
jgi:hypothetical protein